MKRLVLILIVVLMFALTGCMVATEQEDVNEYTDCLLHWKSAGFGSVKGSEYYTCIKDDIEVELTVEEYLSLQNYDEIYYTQEEVDSLLRQQNMEIRQDLMEYYIQSYDGKLYTNCRIEDSIKVCDEIILDDN